MALLALSLNTNHYNSTAIPSDSPNYSHWQRNRTMNYVINGKCKMCGVQLKAGDAGSAVIAGKAATWRAYNNYMYDHWGSPVKPGDVRINTHGASKRYVLCGECANKVEDLISNKPT